MGELAAPIIGIVADVEASKDARTGGFRYRINANYADAIRDAGGVPILLTPATDPAPILALVHGILIPGGLDLDAERFGELNHPANSLIPERRVAAELALLELMPPDMPLLGICYGCQLVNVFRGGKLEQHLPDVLGHDDHSQGIGQLYELARDSRLASLMGTTRPQGKSYHHQAVSVPGAGLKVVGTHDDGTIEALEDPEHPFLILVQWHPERTPRDAETQRLFRGFVHAARAYSEKPAATADGGQFVALLPR
jgi:putative glutamine amidotransferase